MSNHQNMCFIVDECDSVLYDNAGHKIRSSTPQPSSDKIIEITKKIAQLITNYYRSDPQSVAHNQFDFPNQESSNNALLDVKLVCKNAVTEIIKNESNQYLTSYVNSELDHWIDDALKVLDPKSSYQDGIL